MIVHIPWLIYIITGILWGIGSIFFGVKFSWGFLRSIHESLTLIAPIVVYSLIGIGIIYYLDISSTQSKLLKSLLFILGEFSVFYYIYTTFKLTF